MMYRNITKVALAEKLEQLSEVVGLNFKALYYNGFCHIGYDTPNGGVQIIAVGTKSEMYTYANAMIRGSVYHGA